MSATTLAVVAVPPIVTPDQLALVKQTVAQGATDAELKLYLYDCARQGVHPLDRLLHFTKRGGKYTPVTSIDLMRTRAADTGEYAGSDDAVFEFEDTPIPPASARVTVWRFVQGQRCAFTATARWMEYCPASGQDHMWRKMPHTMLAKCAEALALRKGFPRQLAGLYAKEEMDQAGPDIAQIAPLVRQDAPEPTTAVRPAFQAPVQPAAPQDDIAETMPTLEPVISDAQRKRFFAIGKSKGWTTDAMKQMLEAHGFLSSSAVTKAAYQDICAVLERGPQTTGQDAAVAGMPTAEEIF